MEVEGLAITAHELKAPIVTMRQLALSLDFAVDEIERKKIQTDLIRMSENALGQIDDLVKMRRLDGLNFPLEPVSVRAVCDEVVDNLNVILDLNQIQIEKRYVNRSKTVVANKDLLKSVISNFCVNAIKYSDRETVSKLIVKEKLDNVMVQVRDYGPALPNYIWNLIRYGKLDKPVNVAMRPNSSGLGLMIAYQFTKYMGANLNAIRHRDGTSFLIELPISRQKALFE